MAFKYIQRKYGAFLNPGGTFVDIGSVRLKHHQCRGPVRAS
jgi:hypothetical protein